MSRAIWQLEWVLYANKNQVLHFKICPEHDVKLLVLLKKNGFIVYRIEWNEINSENGKQLMKTKIDKFLQWYNELNLNK